MDKKPFVSMINNKEYTILGIMSGTSLDGVDIAVVRFDCENKFKIMAATTIPYSIEWKTKLQNANQLPTYDFLKLHKEYGHYLGTLTNQFLNKTNLTIDFIASHGHTIFHEPQNRFNFQLGDGAVIAAATRITTISDFRTLDIALGGQGAPLVPMGDEQLFSNFDYCLNLGGIANISYTQNHQRIAYDVCPTNMVLNYMAQKAGFDYDNKGNMASNGNIINELLQKLNKLDYYQNNYPKSIGREWVEQVFLPIIQSYQFVTEDILATIVEHIAVQISNNIHSPGKLLITGGGAYNDFLINRIQANTFAKVIIPEPEIIEYKEALIFAYLGLLRIQNKPNTLSSVTGAPFNVCSGIIHQI